MKFTETSYDHQLQCCLILLSFEKLEPLSLIYLYMYKSVGRNYTIKGHSHSSLSWDNSIPTFNLMFVFLYNFSNT